MRLEHEIHIQVACTTPVLAGGALAGKAQSLSVDSTFRNADPKAPRHTLRHALIIDFRHDEIKVNRPAGPRARVARVPARG